MESCNQQKNIVEMEIARHRRDERLFFVRCALEKGKKLKLHDKMTNLRKCDDKIKCFTSSKLCFMHRLWGRKGCRNNWF